MLTYNLGYTNALFPVPVAAIGVVLRPWLHCLHSLALRGRTHVLLIISSQNPGAKPEVFFQVETWLNHVLAHMKATVRYEMTDGVTAYEEKPREQWLFDYPAQVHPNQTFMGPGSTGLSFSGPSSPFRGYQTSHSLLASQSGEAGL